MPPMTRAQVREQLTSIDQARATTVRASATPMIVTAAGGVLFAAAWVLLMLWHPWSIVVGLALMALAIWIGTRRRRRGRLIDLGTARFQAVTFALFLLPVLALPDILGVHRPLAHLLIAGAFIAVWGFAYLRLDEHYQNRRLASGHFDPRNLI